MALSSGLHADSLMWWGRLEHVLLSDNIGYTWEGTIELLNHILSLRRLSDTEILTNMLLLTYSQPYSWSFTRKFAKYTQNAVMHNGHGHETCAFPNMV